MKLADTITYESLHQPVSKEDIRTFKSASKKLRAQKVQNKTIITVGISVGIVMVGALVAMFVVISTIQATSFIPLIFLLVLIVAGVGVFFYFRARTLQLTRMNKFADSNKLSFIHDVAGTGYNGMIFDEGHSRRIQEAYIFADGTELGNYQYVTGSGKNQSTHNWGYCRIKLSRALPNMVLDARKNNIFGRISNLPDSFNKDQTLSLEGDFNRHFTLYAPTQYKTDALYVFTPDVMAAVVDAGNVFDMEVVDNDLFLYSAQKISLDKEENLRTILNVIDTVAEEIRDQSEHYRDERVANAKVNMIAPEGKRLKERLSWTTIVVFVLFILYYVFQFFVDISR